MWAWSEHSSVPVRQEVIPGGHFAAFQEPELVIQIICDDLHSVAGREHGAGVDRIAGSAGGGRIAGSAGGGQIAGSAGDLELAQLLGAMECGTPPTMPITRSSASCAASS
jgi:hypothetical protein